MLFLIANIVDNIIWDPTFPSRSRIMISIAFASISKTKFPFLHDHGSPLLLQPFLHGHDLHSFCLNLQNRIYRRFTTNLVRQVGWRRSNLSFMVMDHHCCYNLSFMIMISIAFASISKTKFPFLHGHGSPLLLQPFLHGHDLYSFCLNLQNRIY